VLAEVQQLTGQNFRGSDPQQLNSYIYSRDNLIVNKGPCANAFGVDDAAGFLAGVPVGTGAYALTSVITQQPITLGGNVGPFITGGKKWFRNCAQDDKWNFCLTAGTLVPANQERP
jgi:hypothetical protein